jgi:hypothetical protein
MIHQYNLEFPSWKVFQEMGLAWNAKGTETAIVNLSIEETLCQDQSNIVSNFHR